MRETDRGIDFLCGNYDEMTDEGKNELLTIGEKYLNEIKVSGDKRLRNKIEELKFEDNKLV
jgi:hypothetical protein